MYVTEKGRQTRLWLGSANATTAAFDGHSEFVVELQLDRRAWGIDQILDEGKTSLRSMLTPYAPASADPAEPTELETATRTVDAVLRELAAGKHRVHVTPADGHYRLDLSWTPMVEGLRNRLRAHSIDVEVWPATSPGLRVAYSDSSATVPTATLQAITSFLVIEATTRVDGQDVRGRTLVNAHLSGAPEDRREQLLATVLDDPDKVLRYLLFLLAEMTGDAGLARLLGSGSGSFSWNGSASSPPLLETLLKALARSPETLDRVAEFVDDLTAVADNSLLPPDFEDIWGPIAQAKEELS